MATSIIRRGGKNRAPKQGQRGFSLIEVLISMVILTVGLVSLLGVFGLAMAATQTTQQDMIAKQLANEALESIVTARNTAQMNWDKIQNTTGTQYCVNTSPPCGIFVSGSLPIYNAGADGIFGTTDDSTAGEETLHEPGPDGIYGNSDDVYIPLTGYKRTILISPVYDADNNVVLSVRAVNITVQYTTSQAQLPKSYVVSSFISEFQ